MHGRSDYRLRPCQGRLFAAAGWDGAPFVVAEGVEPPPFVGLPHEQCEHCGLNLANRNYIPLASAFDDVRSEYAVSGRYCCGHCVMGAAHERRMSHKQLAVCRDFLVSVVRLPPAHLTPALPRLMRREFGGPLDALGADRDAFLCRDPASSEHAFLITHRWDIDSGVVPATLAVYLERQRVGDDGDDDDDDWSHDANAAVAPQRPAVRKTASVAQPTASGEAPAILQFMADMHASALAQPQQQPRETRDNRRSRARLEKNTAQLKSA